MNYRQTKAYEKDNSGHDHRCDPMEDQDSHEGPGGHNCRINDGCSKWFINYPRRSCGKLTRDPRSAFKAFSSLYEIVTFRDSVEFVCVQPTSGKDTKDRHRFEMLQPLLREA